MRQLKAFMKAKKWVCSKKCECLTINMWRCADLQNGEEFCGCGDAATSGIGNKVYVELVDTASNSSKIRYFTNWKSWEDYILNSPSGMELYGIFNSAGGQVLEEIVGDYLLLFTMGKWWNSPTTWQVWTIDADVMVLVRKVFEDPSEENKQELTNFLQAHMEAAQGWDTNAFLVTYPASWSSIIVGDKEDIMVGTSWRVQFLVSPNNESITAVSDKPELLRIDSVAKLPGEALNVRTVDYTWDNVWTATITVTCVNDPSVSVTTPTITITPTR